MGASIPILDSPAAFRYGDPALEYGATPAAGAHFIQTIPGQYRARLITFFCRLVTDANAADRTVVLEYRDAGDLRYAMAAAPVTQSASTTTDYAFQAWQGQADWPADDTVLVPLVPITLPPTHDFRLYVDNIQATDAVSRVRFVWERFYTGDSPPA